MDADRESAIYPCRGICGHFSARAHTLPVPFPVSLSFLTATRLSHDCGGTPHAVRAIVLAAGYATIAPATEALLCSLCSTGVASWPLGAASSGRAATCNMPGLRGVTARTFDRPWRLGRRCRTRRPCWLLDCESRANVTRVPGRACQANRPSHNLRARRRAPTLPGASQRENASA